MLDSTHNMATPGGGELRLPLAGLASRSLAWLIDAVIKIAVLIAWANVLPRFSDAGISATLASMLGLIFLYNVLFEVCWRGATPGKRALGIAVRNADGSRVGWRGSILRNAVRLVDAMPGCYALGCLSVLTNRDFRRIGDLAAGTVVVHTSDGYWQASDAGARITRQNAAAVYRAWFAVTLPLFGLALAAVYYSPYPTLATFAYWWLEPVLDGAVLRVLAGRSSAQASGMFDALRSAPGLAWRNRRFLGLPYRFHFARSIAMPLTQLEGLQGTALRSRASDQNHKILSYGTGVTVAYQHLALAVELAAILIGSFFIPVDFGNLLQIVDPQTLQLNLDLELDRAFAVLGLAAFYVAQTALEPWFVGAGYGLYAAAERA